MRRALRNAGEEGKRAAVVAGGGWRAQGGEFTLMTCERRKGEEKNRRARGGE